MAPAPPVGPWLRCGPAWAGPRQVGAYRMRVLTWRVGAGWQGARWALAAGGTVPLAARLEGPGGGHWWPALDLRWVMGAALLVAYWWGWRGRSTR